MCLPFILPHIIGRADTRGRPYNDGLRPACMIVAAHVCGR